MGYTMTLQNPERFSRNTMLLVGALGTYLVLGFGVCLTTVPLADEAYISNPSYNLATKGILGTTLFSTRDTARAVGCFTLRDCLGHNALTKQHQESYFGMTKYTYWVFPTYLVLQGGWYLVWGFGLIQTRLLSLFSGLILMMACYWIVLALFHSSRAALIAVWLLAIDMTQLTTGAFGRMDMFCAGMGYLGIALYVRWRELRLDRAVLWSHAAAAVASFTNPTGALAAFGLVALAVYLDRRRLRIRHLLLAAIPYLTGAIAWGFYIARAPTIFLSQFLGNATGRGSKLFAPLDAIKTEILDRYGSKFGFGPGTSEGAQIKAVILAVFVLACIAAVYLAWKFWGPEQRALLLLLAVYEVILTFGEGMKFAFYLIHIVPLYVGICAVVADQALVIPARSLYRTAAWVCLLAMVMVDLVVWFNRIKTNPYAREFAPLARYLKPQLEGISNAVCTPSIALGLGFPVNCPFDTGLGLSEAGNRPALIAVSDDWLRDFDDGLAQNSGYNRRIHGLLNSEYTSAYASKRYSVYRRR